MTRKKVATTIYITADQDRLLKLLAQAMNVPVAELIRGGIDLILDQHRDRLPTQLGLFGDSPEGPAPAPPDRPPNPHGS